MSRHLISKELGHVRVNVAKVSSWKQKKIAWVKWETVCLPKQNGGLGIKDIRTFNKALLGKWRWDLFHKHKELWARILASKYGGWRSLVDAKRVSNESVW